MRRRATFNFYVSLDDELDADALEIVIGKMMGWLNGSGIPVLNATWNCPELGRKTTPPGPVLAFERRADVPADRG